MSGIFDVVGISAKLSIHVNVILQTVSNTYKVNKNIKCIIRIKCHQISIYFYLCGGQQMAHVDGGEGGRREKGRLLLERRVPFHKNFG